MAKGTDDSESNVNAAPTPIPTPLNVTALAKAHGLNRRTVQRRLKRGWTPPTAAPTGRGKRRTDAAPSAATTPHPLPQETPRQISNQILEGKKDLSAYPPNNFNPAYPPNLAAAPPAATPQRRNGLHLLVLAVAIGLAAVAAFFSVSGMLILFPAAPVAVGVMGGAMEAGKIVGAAWLSREWRRTSDLLRATLTALIATLAVINAVGVYGRLTAAHLTVHTAAMAATEQDASTIGAHIEAQIHVVADIDRRIAQIDAVIDEATRRGRTASAMNLAGQQQRNRDALVAQRQREAAALVSMKADQAQVTAESRQVEADIGPLQYAAMMLGIEREQAMRLLILMIVLSLDPMAIALVIAVAGR
jgi:hypothetical protein